MLHTDFRRENEHIRYIQTLEGENEHEKSLLRMRSPCFNNMRMNDQYRLWCGLNYYVINQITGIGTVWYRVSQKTWEFSDEFDIVFSNNSLIKY